MFANIDINRDLEHLVNGPMTDLDGLPSSAQTQEMLQAQAPTPIMMQMHSHHFGSPAASPMTSTASQEEDMSSAYSPSMSHAAYGPYMLGEAAMLRPPLRGSSWLSLPLRHERSSQHQSLKRVRKSLPSSPMRGHPSARSTSFGEAVSPSSVASSVRCRSPAGKEHRVMRMESPSSTSSTSYFAGERATKDEFLVKSRRAGMTYRDIKQQGGFTEAESTLRGRYRMLTKSREERVRNPKWTPIDVVLLRKAVLKYCNGKDPVLVKVPWKEVARFIFDNGGTYLFGNATCRKKWDELTSFGMDREVEEDEEVCEDGARDGEGEELEDDEDDDDEKAVK
ncbi:hypothetical protein ESCO_000096 [Escovopsis weberi]|uniref:Myb-like domain-containing protein n=1 Tax=Escovopsis weberi TaxID=150374 RepID=A0A0M8MUU1_ESCWE|nr:hypothetical protein ESCO_000096 [Escovopsis weberi]